jgi:Ni,Fe-hydrogenase I cytochrome b subunit
LAERLTSTGMIVTGHHYAHGLHSPYWWLKCLVGTTNDEHPLVKRYHQLLVWDIMKKPAATRYAEQVLSPMMGKSIVLYLRKPQ